MVTTVVFDVHLNGEPVCRAGLDATGVLSTIVSWHSPGEEDRPERAESLRLRVGGISNATDEHVLWIDTKLKVGDRITIEITEDGEVEEPRGRRAVERHEPPDPSLPRQLKLAKP